MNENSSGPVAASPQIAPASRLLRLLVVFAAAFHFTEAMAARPAATDTRPKLVLMLAEKAYGTMETLPVFAARQLQLEKDFRVVTVRGQIAPEGPTDFDGIGEIAAADVLLLSVTRRTPPTEQLDLVRRHVARGKPVIGIRTASHAFSFRAPKRAAAGYDDWPEWDAEVFGGKYHSHFKAGTVATVTASGSKHSILRGVKTPFEFQSMLYEVRPLRTGAEPLLLGTVTGQPSEPVAWTFVRADGGRSFYTSLGVSTDFQNPAFVRLLCNGVLWAADRVE